ncbi:phytoene/squalene synthase family protein [Shinella sp. CPCC 101442]|uniref:phytoene/squalene synthase family protein n=1 Tax=Shinella sp. CPCC 101442 TaxID=2932265 RepID=UPI00215356FE|nr:phytoene/squalene synthase family protein [Shinella sp. CPCC 101442]MCR6501828.1 phytoene/squalene synthase family protein [Shinella sp. CPCC 101442]
MTDTKDNYAHCLAVLRDTDRDRYLACLLAPAEKRGPLAALYAFHAEIARVRDLVREALPGEIRLQWWRDLLEGEADGDAMANPLAAGLLTCVKEHRLPVAVLTDMIEARIFDVYNDPMENRAALEGYAGETASALIQLASLILDPASAPESAVAAGHAGVAQTVAGTLLLLPIHRRRGQIYLPADLMAATGLTPEALLAGNDPAAATRAIEAFVGLGRDHLAKARAAGGVSRANRAAFLPVALVEPILAAVEKAGAIALERSLQPAQWRRQWWMWLAMRRGPF